jgi:hypothetical protein
MRVGTDIDIRLDHGVPGNGNKLVELRCLSDDFGVLFASVKRGVHSRWFASFDGLVTRLVERN